MAWLISSERLFFNVTQIPQDCMFLCFYCIVCILYVSRGDQKGTSRRNGLRNKSFYYVLGFLHHCYYSNTALNTQNWSFPFEVFYIFYSKFCALPLVWIKNELYRFKINIRNTRKRCEICSKLTLKTPEHVSDVVLVGAFIFNFEHVLDLF